MNMVCSQCGVNFVSAHRAAKFCSQKCSGLAQQHPLRIPKQAFQVQRSSAKWRDIEWFLTFEEWWDIWEKSGKWTERGRGINQYCMARFNVRITTVGGNHEERVVSFREFKKAMNAQYVKDK